MRAFAKALELGVSTLELDIVLTRDDQPLVWHDPTIEPDKCTDTGPAFAGDPQYPYVGKLVHDLSLVQVRTLDCSQLQPDFPNAEVVRGNTIAILPEVFALASSYGADVRYNIEAKVEAEKPGTSADPQEFVDVILAAVRSADTLDSVEFQSFDWRTLQLMRRAEPAIPLVALFDQATWRPNSPWLAGIDPAVVGDPVVGAALVGANILAPEHSMIDRGFVDRAHALGFKVIPWVVNDAETMREQIGIGVDGFITDHPAVARQVLARLDMRLPPAYHRK